MLATLGSHIDCVHMLLERGSNPDTGDRRSHTALHRAVSLCFARTVPMHVFGLCI